MHLTITQSYTVCQWSRWYTKFNLVQSRRRKVWPSFRKLALRFRYCQSESISIVEIFQLSLIKQLEWSFFFYFTRTSTHTQDLVKKMLFVDPKKRYKAIDVLNHSFIRNRDLLPSHLLSHQEPSLIKANMGRVFDAINVPPLINLEPVNTSELARRRAKRRSISIHWSLKNDLKLTNYIQTCHNQIKYSPSFAFLPFLIFRQHLCHHNN